MAIDNLPNVSDESRLSGAYIRTLVKQLTTSSKPLNTTENFIISNDENTSIVAVEDYNHSISSITSNKKGDKLSMAKPNNQQVGHKKQVRRRLHTSRPYQERLLNMAEARKEIVTALKFHRAAMKQANEQQRHQQLDAQQHSSLNPLYHNCVPQLCVAPNNNSSCYPWGGVSSPPLVEPPPIFESLNIPLPNQTLGLNLNLQAFTNLDTNNFCHSIINTTNNNNNPSSSFKYNNSFSSSMSPTPSSSSSSTPCGVATMATTEGVGPTSGMHPALGEEEMAEIRSIGEQHQIEWDDTLNLVKSAWWFKFLKTVDIGRETKGEDNECFYSSSSNNNATFGELMDFPPWLSANNDQSFLQQHLDDSCSEDTTLPWMDIGDIDGLEDEWLT